MKCPLKIKKVIHQISDQTREEINEFGDCDEHRCTSWIEGCANPNVLIIEIKRTT